MKFVDISTALYHLFHREQPATQPPQPQTIYIFQHVCITHGEPLQEVAPGTWQCPKPHTSPVPVIEQPHGRYFLAERSRYSAVSREPTHELRRVKLEPMPPSTYEPKSPNTDAHDWINPESSALYQLSQLAETQHDLKAVRERHESRGKAS